MLCIYLGRQAASLLANAAVSKRDIDAYRLSLAAQWCGTVPRTPRVVAARLILSLQKSNLFTSLEYRSINHWRIFDDRGSQHTQPPISLFIMTMHLNPLYWLIECWARAIRKKHAQRLQERDDHRHKATQAWHARLPPVRSVDEASSFTSTLSNISTQSDSHFFGKLPLEIRRLIYTHMLSGESLHFYVPDENKEYHGDEIWRENVPFTLNCHAARALLAFSSSCKIACVRAGSCRQALRVVQCAIAD
jgi:hypothetical protein